MSQAPHPTDEQHAGLQIVYGAFAPEGRWPIFDVVDRQVYRRFGVELPQLMEPLRSVFVLYDTSGHPESPVKLTVAGVAQCTGTEDDLQRFFDAVAWCVRRELEHEPAAPQERAYLNVDGAELLAGLPARSATHDQGATGRLFELLAEEGVSSGSSGHPAHGSWSISLDRSVRRFTGADSVDTLWSVQRNRFDGASAHASPAVEDAPASWNVFVIMPFHEPWSDPVHSAIRLACHTPVEGRDIASTRADEISRTGRITDQIVEAIRDANIVIADITDPNPNVMYELGYADALGKPVIILNQDIEHAPFDLRELRAITYVPDALRVLEETIRRFLESELQDAPQATPGPVAPTALASRPPGTLRPATEHVTGAFNFPLYGGLNCWVANDGPGAVVLLGARLEVGGAELEGLPRSDSGEELRSRPLPAGREGWIEFPPGDALNVLRSDRTLEPQLIVHYRAADDAAVWCQPMRLRRALDDGSRAQWTAVEMGVPELD